MVKSDLYYKIQDKVRCLFVMRVVRITVAISILLQMTSLSFAQCPDFTNLDGSGVTCQYGVFDDPFQYTGIASGRHTVITNQGGDPYTGYQLPFLPQGENRVVKLGNEQVGKQAEAITYQFTVDPDYAILLLKFAVVLEDPGHPAPAQPRFVVRVLNNNGQLVKDCAEYDVTAAGDIPGFQSYTSGWYNVRWRPWTNVGIDLSDYAGQQIKLQFVTYDCDYWGHFGYAYFTASCISNKLTLEACNGSQATLSAPLGFESYAWDNGSSNTTATYTINSTTTTNCLITSATGCTFTLSATLSSQNGLPTFSATVYDTICEGDSYSNHFFNLPPQWDTGTHIFRNTFFNTSNCTGGDVTITLFLTVAPHYFHIYDAVCQGEDYSAHGFHYTNLQTGLYTDTLETTLPTGCDLVIVLHLSVNPSFNMPNTITGETTVCSQEVVNYALQNAQGLAAFQWNVPTGVNILYGQGTSEVSLYFTGDAPNPTIISLTGTNGCGSRSIPITVTHYPSYHIFFQDTICTKQEYHNYGFDLSRQDSIGYFTFMNNYTTENGCDSAHILQLLVTATPSLTSLAQPADICAGQSATVHALGDNSGIITVLHPPAVAVGDILCTDHSIAKPSDWPVSGKTAKGIVFYVDATGEHGWAANLHAEGNYAWFYGASPVDISALPNFAYSNARAAITDFDGYTNTLRIRSAGNATTYPAAYAVDFNNGWYIPAAGQLSVLMSVRPIINHSLNVAGGDSQFLSSMTSTECDSSSYWLVSLDGFVGPGGKVPLALTGPPKVHSICNF